MDNSEKYLGSDDCIELQNPYLKDLGSDYLYHLGLSSMEELEEKFGDVKYVCMGGSADRAKVFADKAASQLGFKSPEEFELCIPDDVRRDFLANYGVELPGNGAMPIGKTERFSMFKVGSIISGNHGMGIGSLEIFLNEMAKLLAYAKATGVKFLRLGTSGGIGVPPGTAVITDQAYDEALNPYHGKYACGVENRRETRLSAELAKAIFECRGDIFSVIGGTVAANGFYENQGRLDGAICHHTEDDKMVFLRKAHALGARNMEMEATEFASFTGELRIPSAIICSTLLDRLKGDQVTSTPAELAKFADNSQQLALNFIKRELGIE